MSQPKDADADAIDSLFYSAVADGPPRSGARWSSSPARSRSDEPSNPGPIFHNVSFRESRFFRDRLHPGQLLPEPFLNRPYQPVMSWVGVDQDHQDEPFAVRQLMVVKPLTLGRRPRLPQWAFAAGLTERPGGFLYVPICGQTSAHQKLVVLVMLSWRLRDTRHSERFVSRAGTAGAGNAAMRGTKAQRQ
jgi:hypothetical protein